MKLATAETKRAQLDVEADRITTGSPPLGCWYISDAMLATSVNLA
jgi:hypothetical protein